MAVLPKVALEEETFEIQVLHKLESQTKVNRIVGKLLLIEIKYLINIISLLFFLANLLSAKL